MSDSRGGKAEDIKARLKDALGPEREADFEAVVTRLRAAAGQAGIDVEPEALMARAKDVVGKAEGKVDTERLKQWIDETDNDKLKGWLAEAKSFGASAASIVGAQSERLSERAPGAFDRLLGAAKEKIGEFTGDEELARSGELDRLRGQIKESFAETAGTVEAAVEKAADAAKDARDDTGQQG
jgi:uncharacterized protein YjbJ (UPF0337 family)